jgi:hypothetical protein
MCQEWLQIQCSVPDLPPEASDLISAAVGQTQLLLTKKFLQFHGLINRCENVAELEATEPAVTCSDLDGFWDMMYMQVYSFNNYVFLVTEVQTHFNATKLFCSTFTLALVNFIVVVIFLAGFCYSNFYLCFPFSFSHTK